MKDDNFHSMVAIEAIDVLEQLEMGLLDYETALEAGEHDVSLVHTIFRYAHNFKGNMSLMGEEAAAHLIHAIETHFDAIRNGLENPSLALLEDCLSGIDLIKQKLSGETGTVLLEMERLTLSLEQTSRDQRLEAKNEARLVFPLSADETALLEEARQQRHPVFLIEKVISTDISPAVYTMLPVYEDIEQAGYAIATHPAHKDLPQHTSETVIQIVFAATVPEDELPFIIFDPYKPLAFEETEATDAEPEPLEPAEEQPEARIRILIVEDDFISRFTLSEMLSDFGQCDVAVDGQEAVEAFQTRLEQDRPYRLVCLDIMMPGMTGHEAILEMRALEAQHDIHGLNRSRIVMTTALGDKSNVFLAFSRECDAYLVKPLARQVLVEQMKQLQVIV